MMPALLRAARELDMPPIRSLLEADGLPTEDLQSAAPEFVVACDGQGRIIAAGALQCFAESALLRSVVVSPEARHAGVGSRLVRDLEHMAREHGVKQLILLTQSAERFFAHQGYRAIDRGDAPQAVQQCEEFRALCPASAVCMAKSLAPSP